MASDASIRAFKCPTCGAPLEPAAGALTMKCGYCGSSVVIPQSMRSAPASSSANSPMMWGGVDLNAMVGEAMRLPEVLTMAESGRLDEAAQLYSKITGLSHEDAMKSVESMAAGQAVTILPGTPGPGFQTFQPQFTPSTFTPAGSTPFAGQTFDSSSSPRSSGGGCARVVVGLVVAFAVLGIAAAVGVYFWFSNSSSNGSSTGSASPSNGGAISNPLAPILPIGFANSVLTFGSKGIGPGMFTDARSVGVDGNGQIIVGDYQDGRIQIFDPNGKFVSSFSVGPKVSIFSVAVGQDGTIYAVHEGKISIYDPTGKELKTIQDEQKYYNAVTLGSDGKLYAITEDDTIDRFGTNGKVELEIPNAIESVTGNSDPLPHIAVDGLGNIYIAGGESYLVFKYSPTGKYLNQFGGQNQDPAQTQPGKFVEPGGIVVDGYSRVYVADPFEDVQVFDSTGAYLNSINANAYGIGIDNQNNVYLALGETVQKFQVQKPAGQ